MELVESWKCDLVIDQCSVQSIGSQFLSQPAESYM